MTFIRRSEMSQRVLILGVVLLGLTSSACARVEAVTEIPGTCADVFGGQVCTWARVEGGTLVEAGAVVPVATIEGAPAEMPMAWPPTASASIQMPGVVGDQAGITQLTVNWEAGGHPPGAFMTPHFDFHFYVVPEAEIAAIDCLDERKPATLPAGFVLPDIELPPHMAGMIGVPTLVGLCVPKMGMHGILETEVARTDAFDGTMVIGYYKGEPIFLEPMISRAMLLRRQSFDLPVPVVPGFTKASPTHFHAEYTAASDAYRFVLSGFRPAS
jgi:hypothetical protein